MEQLAFRTLLYRYFFFDWMFRDVSCGSLFERAAAWRHNRSRAHWLVTYLWRWIWCGVLLLAAGSFLEIVLGATVLSALFYVPGAISVPMDALIAVAWLGLKMRPTHL